jgi:DNA-binding transcriptional MerR regulator
MADEPVVIPEKIYFKIGEVCELVGVQAHVLRYWETEFPMLSPQKNKSGQRSYRRRDVEMALRIKQLLYKELFTIAGARKKLQSEHREGSKPSYEPAAQADTSAPTLFDSVYDDEAVKPGGDDSSTAAVYTPEQRDALKSIAANLLELRDMLRSPQV